MYGAVFGYVDLWLLVCVWAIYVYRVGEPVGVCSVCVCVYTCVGCVHLGGCGFEYICCSVCVVCVDPCVGLGVPVAVGGCVCAADAVWVGMWVCGV